LFAKIGNVGKPPALGLSCPKSGNPPGHDFIFQPQTKVQIKPPTKKRPMLKPVLSLHQKRMRFWAIVLTVAGIICFAVAFYFINQWAMSLQP
jgi:hypothetical protein